VAGGGESSLVQDKKVLILDARSYTAAVANRAKGGGCECTGLYILYCFMMTLFSQFGITVHVHVYYVVSRVIVSVVFI